MSERIKLGCEGMNSWGSTGDAITDGKVHLQCGSSSSIDTVFSLYVGKGNLFSDILGMYVGPDCAEFEALNSAYDAYMQNSEDAEANALELLSTLGTQMYAILQMHLRFEDLIQHAAEEYTRGHKIGCEEAQRKIREALGLEENLDDRTGGLG